MNKGKRGENAVEPFKVRKQTQVHMAEGFSENVHRKSEFEGGKEVCLALFCGEAVPNIEGTHGERV